jgi:multidrug resistance efflux pump
VSDCTYECIRLGSEHPDCPAHGVTATLRDKVARLTAALAQSEEARREAEEHADRVERLGQIAVDNARDRAVAAEAKVEAGLDLARTWDQGTECNEVGCRNSFHSAARALRAALGNKK